MHLLEDVQRFEGSLADREALVCASVLHRRQHGVILVRVIRKEPWAIADQTDQSINRILLELISGILPSIGLRGADDL